MLVPVEDDCGLALGNNGGGLSVGGGDEGICLGDCGGVSAGGGGPIGPILSLVNSSGSSASGLDESNDVSLKEDRVMAVRRAKELAGPPDAAANPGCLVIDSSYGSHVSSDFSSGNVSSAKIISLAPGFLSAFADTSAFTDGTAGCPIIVAGPSGAIDRANNVVLAVSVPGVVTVAMAWTETPFAFSGCNSNGARRLTAGILDLPVTPGSREALCISGCTPDIFTALPDEFCPLKPPVFSAINIALVK
jgi:hypothetical protein